MLGSCLPEHSNKQSYNLEYDGEEWMWDLRDQVEDLRIKVFASPEDRDEMTLTILQEEGSSPGGLWVSLSKKFTIDLEGSSYSNHTVIRIKLDYGIYKPEDVTVFVACVKKMENGGNALIWYDFELQDDWVTVEVDHFSHWQVFGVLKKDPSKPTGSKTNNHSESLSVNPDAGETPEVMTGSGEAQQLSTSSKSTGDPCSRSMDVPPSLRRSPQRCSTGDHPIEQQEESWLQGMYKKYTGFIPVLSR